MTIQFAPGDIEGQALVITKGNCEKECKVGIGPTPPTDLIQISSLIPVRKKVEAILGKSSDSNGISCRSPAAICAL